MPKYVVRTGSLQVGEEGGVRACERGSTVEMSEEEARPLLAAGALMPVAAAEEIAEAEEELREAEAQERKAIARRLMARDRLTNLRAAHDAGDFAGGTGDPEGRMRGDVGSSKYESAAAGLAATPTPEES